MLLCTHVESIHVPLRSCSCAMVVFQGSAREFACQCQCMRQFTKQGAHASSRSCPGGATTYAFFFVAISSRFSLALLRRNSTTTAAHDGASTTAAYRRCRPDEAWQEGEHQRQKIGAGSSWYENLGVLFWHNEYAYIREKYRCDRHGSRRRQSAW